MSAGSRECLGCGADVFWMAGQLPAFWCPGCRPSAEEAYEAGRRAERQEGGHEVLRLVGEGLELAMGAGRLAAVRADVAYAADHFERRADVWREHGQRAKGPWSRGCMAKALAFAEKAKDCRRWLETTQ